MPDKPLLDKQFSPWLPDEPGFTFRAKDDLSDIPVKAYLEAIREHYPEESDEVQSIVEWLKRRDQWRSENPGKCKLPDYKAKGE